MYTIFEYDLEEKTRSNTCLTHVINGPASCLSYKINHNQITRHIQREGGKKGNEAGGIDLENLLDCTANQMKRIISASH